MNPPTPLRTNSCPLSCARDPSRRSGRRLSHSKEPNCHWARPVRLRRNCAASIRSGAGSEVLGNSRGNAEARSPLAGHHGCPARPGAFEGFERAEADAPARASIRPLRVVDRFELPPSDPGEHLADADAARAGDLRGCQPSLDGRGSGLRGCARAVSARDGPSLRPACSTNTHGTAPRPTRSTSSDDRSDLGHDSVMTLDRLSLSHSRNPLCGNEVALPKPVVESVVDEAQLAELRQHRLELRVGLLVPEFPGKP
jgi:hypothetical protein